MEASHSPAYTGSQEAGAAANAGMHPEDAERVLAMLDLVRASTAADAFAVVLPPSGADALQALAMHCRFAHGALLVFPGHHDALLSFLGTLDVTADGRKSSVIVRDRLARRLRVPAADLEVGIVHCATTCADGRQRELELFVLERRAIPGVDGLDELVASERLHWHESHLAFELWACDEVVLRGVYDTLVGTGGMSPGGGGYNQHLDVTVLYFAAEGQTSQGWPRRLELTVPGDHGAILAAHLGCQEPAPDRAARDLLRLMTGAWRTQAVAAFAELGVADHLLDGLTSTTELAAATGAEPDNLTRLMRYLASEGILTLEQDGSYALTEVGALLARGVNGSLRDLALLYGGPFYHSFEALAHTIRTGESAFLKMFGEAPFDYFAQHPADARLFERGMAAGSSFLTAVPAALDLAAVRVVVDVAGANGRLLSEILRAAPGARGVLFDRPHVIEAAPEVLAELGCADRCDLVAGDFFSDPVPAGADLYLLSRILHDWDDDRCAVILANIRARITPGTRLAVMERPVPATDSDSLAFSYDVHMMVNNLGGRERTVAEYRALLHAAGFELHAEHPLPLDMAVLLARAV